MYLIYISLFQDPDGAKQITFPRDIEGVRKKDDRRKLVRGPNLRLTAQSCADGQTRCLEAMLRGIRPQQRGLHDDVSLVFLRCVAPQSQRILSLVDSTMVQPVVYAGGHVAQERQRRADRKAERERQEAEEAKRARKRERRAKSARTAEKAAHQAELETDPATQVHRIPQGVYFCVS